MTHNAKIYFDVLGGFQGWYQKCIFKKYVQKENKNKKQMKKKKLVNKSGIILKWIKVR